LGQTQKEIKETIESHGGTFSTLKSGSSVTVLITSKADTEGSAKKLDIAKEEKIALLDMDWLTNLTERDGDGIELRKFEKYEKHLLNDSDTHKELKRIYSTPYQNKKSDKKIKKRGKEINEARKNRKN